MSMNILISIVVVSFVLAPVDTFSAKKNVAKVIILKGKAVYKLKGGKSQSLTKGMRVPEGATVATSKKSFIKLLFTDNSQVSLGPKSQMTINKFRKGKPGVLSVFKGHLNLMRSLLASLNLPLDFISRLASHRGIPFGPKVFSGCVFLGLIGIKA